MKDLHHARDPCKAHKSVHATDLVEAICLHFPDKDKVEGDYRYEVHDEPGANILACDSLDYGCKYKKALPLDCPLL